MLSDAKNCLKSTVLLGEARALGLRPVILDEALQAWQPTEAAILPATIPCKQVGLPAEIPFVVSCADLSRNLCNASQASAQRSNSLVNQANTTTLHF